LWPGSLRRNSTPAVYERRNPNMASLLTLNTLKCIRPHDLTGKEEPEIWIDGRKHWATVMDKDESTKVPDVGVGLRVHRQGEGRVVRGERAGRPRHQEADRHGLQDHGDESAALTHGLQDHGLPLHALVLGDAGRHDGLDRGSIWRRCRCWPTVAWAAVHSAERPTVSARGPKAIRQRIVNGKTTSTAADNRRRNARRFGLECHHGSVCPARN
jgi:hypothetical protein